MVMRSVMRYVVRDVPAPSAGGVAIAAISVATVAVVISVGAIAVVVIIVGIVCEKAMPPVMKAASVTEPMAEVSAAERAYVARAEAAEAPSAKTSEVAKASTAKASGMAAPKAASAATPMAAAAPTAATASMRQSCARGSGESGSHQKDHHLTQHGYTPSLPAVLCSESWECSIDYKIKFYNR